MIKKVSVVAGVLFLIGIIGMALTYKFRPETSEENLHEIIDREGFKQIHVKSDNARIIMIPTTDTTPSIELSGHKKNDKLTTDIKGDALYINLKNTNILQINFDLFPRRLTLKVFVPEEAYESMHVSTENGSIEINDMEVADLLLLTENGHIKLDNIQGQKIKAVTDNGDLKFKGIHAEAVDLETDNGRINLDDVTGAITGRTDNGAILLKTVDLERPLDLETDNGRIEIETENEPKNVVLDLKTDLGRIKVFEDTNWDTVIGSGEHLIKLKTDNGGITIRK